MNSVMNTPNEPPLPSMRSENTLMVVSGELDPACAFTALRLPSGEVVRVATALLIPATDAGPQQDQFLSSDLESVTVPLVAERLDVRTRTVPTGKVRLQKTVQEYEEELNVPLAARTFRVERIALDQVVEAPPPIRQEGDTTIYPILEERLILTKQLVLKEEVRVTKVESETLDTQVVSLRREHLAVERTPV